MVSPGETGGYFKTTGELPSKKSGETQEDIPAKAAYVLLHDIAGGGSAPVTPVGGNRKVVSPRSTDSSWKKLETGDIGLGEYLGEYSLLTIQLL